MMILMVTYKIVYSHVYFSQSDIESYFTIAYVILYKINKHNICNSYINRLTSDFRDYRSATVSDI